MKKSIIALLLICGSCAAGIFNKDYSSLYVSGELNANAKIVELDDDAQVAYDWLKSSDRDSQMGPLSEANQRYLVLVPGTYDGTLVATDENVLVSELSSGTVTSAGGLRAIRPEVETYLGWALDDNAASTAVVANSNGVNGVIVGGKNSDAMDTTLANGKDGLDFDGSADYITITSPNVWPQGRNFWTKDLSNPVLTGASSIQFGEIVPNPLGGWFFYGSKLSEVYRWSSVDLITWTDETLVMNKGAAGQWDETINVVTVFQKPDSSWQMLYRGKLATTFSMGGATSSDGLTWVKQGQITTVGDNYDPKGVILVGETYYCFFNGDDEHDVTNLYTSTDLITFTAGANNPVFDDDSIGGGGFCPHVFYRNGWFYMLICTSFDPNGTNLYDHAISLFRCPDPEFKVSNREFCGHVITNDQSYDDNYLDTPSLNLTNIYHNIADEETLLCIYDGFDGVKRTQSLAYTSYEIMEASVPRKVYRLVDQPLSFSFTMEMSTVANKTVMSVGSTPTDGSPSWLVRVVSGKLEFLYRDAGASNVYAASTTTMQDGVPYHVIITRTSTGFNMYINGRQDITPVVGTNSVQDVATIYLGSGFGGLFDGKLADFRVYGHALSENEAMSLYQNDTIIE
jgi:hypothetical protein